MRRSVSGPARLRSMRMAGPALRKTWSAMAIQTGGRCYTVRQVAADAATRPTTLKRSPQLSNKTMPLAAQRIRRRASKNRLGSCLKPEIQTFPNSAILAAPVWPRPAACRPDKPSALTRPRAHEASHDQPTVERTGAPEALSLHAAPAAGVVLHDTRVRIVRLDGRRAVEQQGRMRGRRGFAAVQRATVGAGLVGQRQVGWHGVAC